MARIRTIKPEYWQDEKVAQLSHSARLLFIGLWNVADDEGRLRGSARFLQSQVFPYEPKADVEAWLTEIAALGMIRRYSNGGEHLALVVNFPRHQKINRPSPSRLPGPDDSGSVQVGLIESSLRPHGGLTVGKEGKGKEGKGTGNVRSADSLVLFSYWQATLGHPRTRLDDDLAAEIERELKTFTVDDLKLAVDGCKASPHHMGQNDRHTVYDGLSLILREPNRFIGYAEKAGKATTRDPLRVSQDRKEGYGTV